MILYICGTVRVILMRAHSLVYEIAGDGWSRGCLEHSSCTWVKNFNENV
jgi:hypothetical protein